MIYFKMALYLRLDVKHTLKIQQEKSNFWWIFVFCAKYSKNFCFWNENWFLTTNSINKNKVTFEN